MSEEKKYSEQESHQKFAGDLNNLVWSFLGKNNRTQEEDDIMVHAAHASYFHWSKVGKAINLQRGEWMISHVYAVLNRPESALYHAQRCLEITGQHKFIDFDLAYAYEAMARAYAAIGEKSKCAEYSKLAKKAGDEIKNKENRELFFSDFETGPWYQTK